MLLRDANLFSEAPRTEQLLPAAFCSSPKSFSRVLSPSPPGAGGAVQHPGVLRMGKSLPLALWLPWPTWDVLSLLSPALAARAEGAGCPWTHGPGKQVTATGSSGSISVIQPRRARCPEDPLGASLQLSVVASPGCSPEEGRCDARRDAPGTATATTSTSSATSWLQAPAWC